MYAVITFPLLNLTLAIFLSPELGFFGFVVPTFKQTPFISGLFASAGDRSFRGGLVPLPSRTTWFRVIGRGADAEKERMGRAAVPLRSAIEAWLKRAGVVMEVGFKDGRNRRRRY